VLPNRLPGAGPKPEADGRYQPWFAHNQAYVRRRRAKLRRFAVDAEMRELVASKLGKHCSGAACGVRPRPRHAFGVVTALTPPSAANFVSTPWASGPSSYGVHASRTTPPSAPIARSRFLNCRPVFAPLTALQVTLEERSIKRGVGHLHSLDALHRKKSRPASRPHVVRCRE
jgi:hypothetical protein